MINLVFRFYFLLFSCVCVLILARSAHLPRIIFTGRDTAIIKTLLTRTSTTVWVLPEEQPDIIMAAGRRRLYTFSSKNLSKTPVEREVLWKECVTSGEACQYNITVLHKRAEVNELFLCGSSRKKTVCCNLDLSNSSSVCSVPEHVQHIKTSIANLILKEGEPSVFIESAGREDLYVTSSGTQDSVGIHKFGKNRVRPASSGRDQYFVGLVLSRRSEDSLQDKIYAFYKEKNLDRSLDGRMWVPYVAQICLADKGGPKAFLQFSWTSELKARLFCGDSESRQHYSELVDMTAVHAEQWRHTRIYALFRNEWGMSAVCVYTVEDIENIFTTSKFKGQSEDNSKRGRVCVADSTKIALEVLRMTMENSDMEEWIQPLRNSAPLLVSHHHYTHICVDSFQDKNNQHTVLFLSLQNGAVHKLMENDPQFVIAEYRPFTHRGHILSMTLHSSTRKLYVSSGSEMVQLDVGSCESYGDRCEECILARDPYCGWNGTHCSSHTPRALQDVENGNHSVCKSMPKVNHTQTESTSCSVGGGGEADGVVTLPLRAKYFLRCPVSSLHARYSWYHNESETACDPEEQQCVLLIDGVGPEQVGTYRCVMEEMGYKKTLAQCKLQLASGVEGRPSRAAVWVCLLLLVIRSVCAQS